MPRSSKRQAEAAESPRSSKRSRAAVTEVKEQVTDTSKSPSGRLKRTRVTAKVAAADGTEIVTKVEKEVPQEKSPRKKLGKPTAKAEVKVVAAKDKEIEKVVAEKAKGKKGTIKVEETHSAVDTEPDDKAAAKPAKKKRKTKEEKEAEMIPLAARTKGLRMFIGAHVSGAGGVHNSVTNAVHIGGNSFALFLKSQRKWDNPALQVEHKKLFYSHCMEHKYAAGDHVLPHGSYLVNLAQAEPDKAKQAYDSFLDDLKRCEALGIRYYNFHPGNTGSHPRPDAVKRIADALNRAHAATSTVIPVLENMAGSGNVIGSAFEDLRDIIALVKDKSRIGVCLDTCHAFAAGYDLRTLDAFRATMDTFDRLIGVKYLRAMHLNDSKAPFNSRRDLHQNIGLGFLGLRAFHNVMNEKRCEGLPMVLETPIDKKDDKGKVVEDKGVWAREIKLLESLIGMDPNGTEFKKMEEGLSEQGAAERAKLQEQADRKADKDAKKGKGKGRGKAKDVEDSDEE
ncbi:MAG: hypothetical protein MMC23_007063 [Stictis urceolatum]|nr:hypothetical protein [Stictis urceolata]